MGASLGSGNSGGRRRSRYKSRSFTEINVTPFVDVMLVLLIVFMVAAPLLTAGVTVDLPEATSDNLPGQDEPLTVTIDSKKRIFLNDTKVSRKNLVTKLKAITKEKTDIRIFVRGDRRVDYGTIMRVIGTMNAAGYGKVGLVTETPSGN